MKMALTITDILNSWNQAGVFSYVLPFLLIFALVFALLQKTAIFAKKKAGAGGVQENQHNSTIEAIIAAAIGLLALQFDMVSIFFANIFPKFGIGLSIFLVLIIFLGFFYGSSDATEKKKLSCIGWVVGIGVVGWALINWNTWFGGGYNFYFWIQDYFWALVVLAVIVGVIIAIKKGAK